MRELKQSYVACGHCFLTRLDPPLPDDLLLPNLFQYQLLQGVDHEGDHLGVELEGLDDCSHEEEGNVGLLKQLLQGNGKHLLGESLPLLETEVDSCLDCQD